MAKHSYGTTIRPQSQNEEIKNILEICDAEVSLYVTADFNPGHRETYDSDGVCIDPPDDPEAVLLKVEAEDVTFDGLESVPGPDPETEYYLTDAYGPPELVAVTKDMREKIMQLAKEELERNWREYQGEGWESFLDS